MIATLIGAGLAVGSSLWGGYKASQAAKKANRQIANQRAANQAWFNRRYNEDYADTAAGQRLITQAKDYAKDNWKKAQGASKVGGATDESAAAAKEAGNKMVGNTISGIAAADTARKDRIDAQYRAMDNSLAQQQIAVEQNRAAQISQAASQASNAMMNAGAYIDGMNASKASDAVKTSSLGGVADVPQTEIRLPQTGEIVNIDDFKRQVTGK